MLLPAASFAQRPEEEEGLALLQAIPYDIIEFKEAGTNGNRVKVNLLDLPDRKVPSPFPQGKLQVTVIGKRAGLVYECRWEEIERIRLWENILIEEAKQLTKEGKFDAAFPYIARLMADFPATPGLTEIRRDFLLRDAKAALDSGYLERALSILEEVRRNEGNNPSETTKGGLSRVIDRMIETRMERQELDDVQELYARALSEYAEFKLPVIEKWRGRFEQLGRDRLLEAVAARKQEQWVEARRMVGDALAIYPDLPEANSLLRELDEVYAIVQVGVRAPAVDLDPSRIDQWSARRAGMLTHELLFTLRGPGPEGANYQFLFGKHELSDDRQQLFIDFGKSLSSSPALKDVNAYDIVDVLLQRATPGTPFFDPTWASLVKHIEAPSPSQLIVQLRRPHVAPIGLLQLRIDQLLGGNQAMEGTGPYQRISDVATDDGLRFQRFRLASHLTPVAGQPKEVIEVTYDRSDAAIQALLTGKIQAIDHLMPLEARRLKTNAKVKVENYPMPTVHMLVPCSDSPYVRDRNFRRALCYGLDRQGLMVELLGTRDKIAGCEAISGPIPAGVGENDPLSYGYNRAVPVQPYEPGVAKLLVTITKKRLETEAKKNEQPVPELKSLRIAMPAMDAARVTIEAMRQQLKVVGVPIEIVPLAPGKGWPEPDTADFVYVAAAMWEPAIDASRVVGPSGLAKSKDQLVGQALRRLEAARSWADVRDGLREIHRICHHELPVIPLFQIVDAYAYRADLVEGVGTKNISLYQNVYRWRLRGIDATSP
jgi:ABC-type transport system substrate-binding protein